MKVRWRKLLMGLGITGVLAVSAAAVTVSYNAPCGTPPPLGAGESMQAITYRCYGPVEVLKLETIAKPEPAADEVRVRVHAASVNPLDKHYMHGTPYILRLSAGIGAPKVTSMGTDFAGTVDAVGASVTRFKPGDRVFGTADGAFGEYLVRRAEGGIAAIPENVSFEQAAAMPIAAVTALQALRDKAGVKPGHKVLINGASGGVGSFAVQIAKALGATVTGVCSTRNVELVESLGADQVIDYNVADFTQGDERYDVIVDMVGNHSIGTLASVMVPEGVLVLVGSVEKNRWTAGIDRMVVVALASLVNSQRIEGLLASMTPQDLDAIAQLANQGQLRAAIDTRYSLAQVPDAMRHLETGRARGKIIISIAE